MLHLFNDGLRADRVADENRRQKRDDGHDNVIADKVKEIQNLIAKDGHVREHAIAQRGGQGKQEGSGKYGGGDYFSTPMKLFHKD